ncbi:MAG: hypothetical protein AAF590_04290 [Pseudomonadota bacterium]
MPSSTHADKATRQARKPARSQNVDWNIVQELYQANEVSVASIARRFHISSNAIYRRAKANDWPMRQPKRVRRHVAPPLDMSKTPKIKHMKAALAARLFHILEERIMAEEEDAMLHDTGHAERDAKAITAMAKALEVLGQMLDADETAAAQGPIPHVNAEDQEIDIDAYRERLIKRIERLREDGPST